MSFANRHNTANANAFTYKQIEGAQYVKLKDLYEAGHTGADTAIRMRGCFISKKSRFGKSSALICEGFNVNLPAHMFNTVQEILQSPEDIKAVNDGLVGFYVYEYQNSQGGKSYSLRWIDMPPVSIDNKDLPY